MILAWLGLAAVTAAAFFVLRWLGNRYDALGRRNAFPWLGVAPLLGIAIGFLTPFFLRIGLENRLARAVSELIGMEVEVRCQSFGEAFVDVGAELGYVPFGPDGVPQRRTLIKRDQCRDLSDYLRSDKREPSPEHVVAVHTLAHEAIHMSGETNEARTECIALQRDHELAALLGAPDEGARRLSVMYWELIYPRMPEGYKSEECRPGGELDIAAPFAPWGSPLP